MIRLANMPTPHITRVAQSVLLMSRSKDPLDKGALPQNALNSGTVMPAPDIQSVDWDVLFHAIQTRLEKCVKNALDHTQDLPLPDRHAAACQAVLECVEDMKQLHVALVQERLMLKRH